MPRHSENHWFKFLLPYVRVVGLENINVNTQREQPIDHTSFYMHSSPLLCTFSLTTILVSANNLLSNTRHPLMTTQDASTSDTNIPPRNAQRTTACFPQHCNILNMSTRSSNKQCHLSQGSQNGMGATSPRKDNSSGLFVE